MTLIFDTSPTYTFKQLPTGVTLAIGPESVNNDVELQRSDDAGATWNTIAILPRTSLNVGGTPYVDRLPTRSTPYHYRAREIHDGMTNGDWFTPYVTASAGAIRNLTAGGTKPVFNMADSYNTGKYLSNLTRNSSSLTAADAIVQNLEDTGHLSSSMNDGLGRSVTGMFHKGLDDLDDVDDSVAVFKRTTANEKTGAGRGFTVIDASLELTGSALGRTKQYSFGQKPTIILARRSTSDGTGVGTVAAGLTALGYSVTTNTGSTVTTCAAYDVVLIDCFAWSVDEHNSFILQLLDNSQRVLTVGNDTTTGFFPITSTSASTDIGRAMPNPARKHALQDGWATRSLDNDSGRTITGLQPWVTPINVRSDNTAQISTFEYHSPAGGILIHDQPKGIFTTDDDKTWYKNVVEYLGGGYAKRPLSPKGTLRFLGSASGSSLASGVTDGTSRAITGMFHKTSDDLDDVDDSIAVYKRTTANEKTGAGRGYNALNTSNRVTTGVEKTGDVGGINAHVISRAQHGVFFESFEEYPSTWNQRAFAGSGSLVQSGSAGGWCYRAAGGEQWLAFPQNIPFDPSKLYRIRGRFRQTVTSSTAGNNGIYLGVEGLAADGATFVNSTGANSTSNQHYVGAVNYQLASSVGQWVEVTGWFKGRGTPVLPANNPRNPSPLYTGVSYIRPLFILNYNAGDGTTDIDELAVDIVDEDATYRTYSALTSDGNLTGSVGLYDGIAVKTIAKNGQAGTARHSGSVTYTPSFQGVPLITFYGGVNYEPGNFWGSGSQIDTYGSGNLAPLNQRVYDDLGPVNSSNTGFTLRARLWQKASTTSQVAQFDGTTATSVGAVCTSSGTLPSAPSNNDTYTVHYKVIVTAQSSVPGNLFSATYTLSVEADPTNTGAWVERATMTYSAQDDTGTTYTSTNNNQSTTVTVTGMSTSGKLRLKVKSSTLRGTGTATISLHGYQFSTDAANGITYTTSTGDRFASKTPDSTDSVQWNAIEVTS